MTIAAICRLRLNYNDDSDSPDPKIQHTILQRYKFDDHYWDAVIFESKCGRELNMPWVKEMYKFEYDIIKRVSSLTKLGRIRSKADMITLMPKRIRPTLITVRDLQVDESRRAHWGDNRVRNLVTFSLEGDPNDSY